MKRERTANWLVVLATMVLLAVLAFAWRVVDAPEVVLSQNREGAGQDSVTTQDEGGSQNDRCMNETTYEYVDLPEYTESTEAAAMESASSARRSDAAELARAGAANDAYPGYESATASARAALYADLERVPEQSTSRRGFYVAKQEQEAIGHVIVEQGSTPESGWMMVEEVVALPEDVCAQLEAREGPGD